MIRKLIRINSLAVIVSAAFSFIYPPVRAVLDIGDPALRVILPIVKRRKAPKGVEDWPGATPIAAAPESDVKGES